LNIHAEHLSNFPISTAPSESFRYHFICSRFRRVLSIHEAFHLFHLKIGGNASRIEIGAGWPHSVVLALQKLAENEAPF
jgi:hypothetical protein